MPALPPCDRYRVLTLNYTNPEITPEKGYIVKWRVVGELEWNTLEGLLNNPILIPNVPACYNIEGTIQADCGSENLGKEVYFAATSAFKTCFIYSLETVGTTYTYTSCSTNKSQSVTVSSTPITVSAYEGSISPTTGVVKQDAII
jgi:hypothetical protein